MSFHDKTGKLRFVASSILLLVVSAYSGSAQNKPDKTKQKSPTVNAQSGSQNEEARLKQYLDKDGGYKDNEGGYYNPKARTYTDAVGGIVDSWQGYIYTDGSYKSKLGDYWDEPSKTFKLANGETQKAADTTSAEAIKLMRENVQENGGYSENGIYQAMMARIGLEHPLTPGKPRKRP
jgi:hypothetical protein